MDTAALLQANFRARLRRNAKYSLRAFARDVHLDHGALSQILSGRRPVTARLIRRLAGPLGIDGDRVLMLIAAENERKVVRHLRKPSFRPSVRELSIRSGLSMDAICIVLQRMLAGGRLSMCAPNEWRLEKRP